MPNREDWTGKISAKLREMKNRPEKRRFRTFVTARAKALGLRGDEGWVGEGWVEKAERAASESIAFALLIKNFKTITPA